MRFLPYLSIVLAISVGTAAHVYAEERDVLGAHLNYGRGCSACHISHTAAFRDHNGSVSKATMLWGEDVSSTYRCNGADGFHAGDPAKSSEQRGALVCLTCHTGNYAPAAMLKNSIYEALPYKVDDPDSIPTFSDKPADESGKLLSRHPSGINVHIRCGGAQAWDCVERDGTMTMAGARSSRFAANYGFFLKQHSYGDERVVLCTPATILIR